MANGKVITGFSHPWVARYANNGGVVTYTDAMPLARGVNVSIEPETGDDNVFYADNIAAESAPGVFTGGTATFEVDGLLADAEAFVFGLPEAETIEVGSDTVNVQAYGDEMNIPYVGVGFIVRYMSDGVTTYAPMMLTKARFVTPGTDAATQEEEIDWQTQELEAALMRDDTAQHNWKKIADDQTTEADALEVVKVMLGVTGGA